MGQAEILKFLEENLEETMKQVDKLNNDLLKKKEILANAKSKEDLSYELGISLRAVTQNLIRLIKQEHILVLKDEIDKRKNKYVINDERIDLK